MKLIKFLTHIGCIVALAFIALGPTISFAYSIEDDTGPVLINDEITTTTAVISTIATMTVTTGNATMAEAGIADATHVENVNGVFAEVVGYSHSISTVDNAFEYFDRAFFADVGTWPAAIGSGIKNNDSFNASTLPYNAVFDEDPAAEVEQFSTGEFSSNGTQVNFDAAVTTGNGLTVGPGDSTMPLHGTFDGNLAHQWTTGTHDRAHISSSSSTTMMSATTNTHTANRTAWNLRL